MDWYSKDPVERDEDAMADKIRTLGGNWNNFLFFSNDRFKVYFQIDFRILKNQPNN